MLFILSSKIDTILDLIHTDIAKTQNDPLRYMTHRMYQSPSNVHGLRLRFIVLKSVKLDWIFHSTESRRLSRTTVKAIPSYA
jgi:hypothetical protein